MKYLEFMDYVKEHFLEYLPGTFANAEAEVVKYNKNGMYKDGITILKDGKASHSVGITMELAPLYNAVENGTSLDSVMQMLAEGYLDGVKLSAKLGKSDASREHISKNLFCIAVNYERSNLNGIPYLQITDLAIIAKSRVSEKAVITITDDVADYIGVDGDTLVAMAIENNVRVSPPILYDLNHVHSGRFKEIPVEDLTPAFFRSGMKLGTPMWALSNEDKTYGASLISHKTTLNKISKLMGTDLVLLPSSMHELIICPKGVRDLGTMKSIVEDENQRLLNPVDFLSNNIYVYDAVSQDIKMYDSELHKEFVQARLQKLSGPCL